MGCDIHCFIETRQAGTTEWQIDPQHLANPDERDRIRNVTAASRWYALFGVLAGVRVRTVRQIDIPRGFPEDITPELRAYEESWGSDLHHKSWCTVEEFEEALGIATQHDGLNYGYQAVRPLERSTYRNPFFRYEDYDWKDIPWYPDIVNYCKELQIDNILLDRPPLEVRIVFAFDN